MNAILLAGGYGSRLLEITKNNPKCLLPVRGEPLLGFWLKKLDSNGVEKFLVNTHFKNELVERYVSCNALQKQVTLVYEPQLLGTAGTLLKNINFFNGKDGLLIHADNYCLDNLEGFIAAHNSRPNECLMTMMTFRTNSPSGCGIVELDSRGMVIGFHEKKERPPGNLANAAIYCLSSQMCHILCNEYSDANDFSLDIIPNFIGKIYTYETMELLVDIGTPEAYKSVNSLNSKNIN